MPNHVWLAQVNHSYGRSLFLPYSAGCLQAYAQAQPDIAGRFSFDGFVVRREPIDAVIARMERVSGRVDVLGLSVYAWNARYSAALAAAVRERWPECLIVVGGPQVDRSAGPANGRANHLGDRGDPRRSIDPHHGPEAVAGFPLGQHQQHGAADPVDLLGTADVAVLGEGELAFAAILRAFADVRSRDICGVLRATPDLDVRHGVGGLAVRAERIRDLGRLPSPYLAGCFDGLLADGETDWQASLETNRGCPYQSYGGDTYVALPDRLLRFDEQVYASSAEIICPEPGHVHAVGLHDERIMRQAVKPCITLKLSNGLSLTVTPKHGVHRVNVEDETIIECSAEEIVVGDWLPVEVGQNEVKEYVKLMLPSMDIYPKGIGRRRPEEVDLPDVVSEDLAWFMGYVVGDGCLANSKKNPSGFRSSLHIAVHKNLSVELRDRIRRLFHEELHLDPSTQTNDMLHGFIHRRMVVRFFRETLGMCGGDEKLRVPDVIKRSPSTVVRAFLDGLYAADGHKQEFGVPYLTTVSSRLAQEVAHCIHWIGDAAVIRGPYTQKEGGHAPIYRVEWHGQECFDRTIGHPCVASHVPFSGSLYRSSKSGKVLRRTVKSPERQRVSRKMLAMLDSEHPLVDGRFVYVQVVDILDAGEVQTYDVHHHPSHKVAANGVYTRQCAFCAWGLEALAKLYQFPDERILGELRWCGEHRIRYAYSCDANYGILKRDIEFTRALVETKRVYGFPQEFRACTAKNSNDRVFEIARLLHEAGMSKGATLSLQSLDPDTLASVKRTNIKMDDFRERVQRYRQAGIATYTELILGLPGETMGSFAAGLDALLDAGKHEGLNIYLCQVLPGTEFADPDYRTKHGIVTVRSPMLLQHSTPSDDPHAEQEDVIVATAAMPAEDWAQSYMLAWAVQTFHALGLTRYLAMFCRFELGMAYTEFYRQLLQYAHARQHLSRLGEEYLTAVATMRRGVSGGGWGVIDRRFGDVVWPSEELSFMRLAGEHEHFYEEIRAFLARLLAHCHYASKRSLYDALIDYQQGLLVRPDDDGPRYLELEHPLHRYFQARLRGEAVPLDATHESLVVLPAQAFAGLADYARRCVWYGRKGGQFTHQRIISV